MLSQEIRDALAKCHETPYRLAMLVKVEEKSLRRFIKGEQGVSLAALDRIGVYLRLRIAQDPAPVFKLPTVEQLYPSTHG